MPIVRFPFHEGYPVVEVGFRQLGGEGSVTRKLLVNSGFTGRSAFVLPARDEKDLGIWRSASAHVRGALSGEQHRTWVMCLVPEIALRERAPGDLHQLPRDRSARRASTELPG